MRPTLARLRAPLTGGLLLSLAAAGGGAAMMAPTAPATQAAPGDARLTYSIHVGGIHVLDADAHLGLDEIYRVGLALETQGILGRIAKWKTDVRAQGQLGDGLPQPQRFTAHGAWDEEPRLTTLEYSDKGAPVLTLADPAPEKDREPVPDALRADTLDPVSAIVAVLDRVGRGQGCDLTVAVYDGRQRYDLAFTDKGQEVLEASDLAAYAGPARRCAVEYKPVAGRWKERPSRRDRDGARPPSREVSLWLAPAANDGDMVPVRLEMDSPLGAVRVHLAQVATVAP